MRQVATVDLKDDRHGSARFVLRRGSGAHP